jgi:hypothetical protein
MKTDEAREANWRVLTDSERLSKGTADAPKELSRQLESNP